jgi:hypothetical protein
LIRIKSGPLTCFGVRIPGKIVGPLIVVANNFISKLCRNKASGEKLKKGPIHESLTDLNLIEKSVTEEV